MFNGKQRYALLSIVAACVTIGLKFGAYLLTGSIGLFSDAAESVVNLIAAIMALWMLTIAMRPPDHDHAFGHSKAEYFASGLEGMLIMLAAGSIIWTAWPRVLNPTPITRLDLGLGLSIFATAINGGVAWIIMRAGKRLRSITLQADAHHLFTDVWTTIGVIGGILLTKLSGWLVLDPLIAIAVALHIIWIGFRILRESGYGLLDSALPDEDQAVIEDILSRYRQRGLQFHALRTRVAGPRRFISLHVLVPGSWSVQKGHDVCETIELAIAAALPDSHAITHLEPLEDPAAWDDEGLDRVNHEPIS
ncbi:MAG TPA: cation transporter [Herpetosiphon sp.]|uniref:Cation diffusion facilitator family transporter n=1 Tax=Herpetosiphon aurantiacus (strain ATCC 23779 / DSM 785 / 114-95) TaxID=316274 RepID=A9AZ82_HERA2|nr:cation diffusion facilitator family transporter [Herpetosiphon sp.]ABX03628.1 cation diffusion facilitator family transporter [Herpetosiphon aurantiacus DSM 785]MCA0352944.1 cation diffusion facilitator family transporter [Chloroflexota bacterium]HBW51644.1 cation transporter [Herpetosiphon sp.]